uniref:R2D2 isoform b n=1 Tax=Mayetiola destructor TaxID=39758 RepID=K7YL12_MAYDE|nr:R2D2 isoform b [Mayetiola destructor]
MGSYEPMAEKYILTNMEEKTPVSQLQELCAQEKVAPPTYEFFRDEHDKKFGCLVQAFGPEIAKGSGLSKMEAKHAAAASLIRLLSQLDRFKDRILAVEHVPAKDKNAVGDLINFCMQHNFPTPNYNVKEGGLAHLREFTAECQVGGSSCIAKGATKQGAKHYAAEAMLFQLSDVENNNNGEMVKPLTFLDLPTIEEIIAEYRRLKTPHIKRETSLLRIRPNFFLKLPKDDRAKASEFITGKDTLFHSDEEIVHLVCESLKLKYKIEEICLKNGIHKIFSLVDCDYDCVIVAKASTLFAKVIKYFKTMLDIKKLYPAMVTV